ncbi:MAG: flagella basal body P-ring formation protein FlgA [Myxococcota bacterium]
MRDSITRQTADRNPTTPMHPRVRPPREPRPGVDRAREPRPTPNPLAGRAGLAFIFAALFASPLHAQDTIRLAEVLPVLAGSELGDVEVADAPPPGQVRQVRRGQILRAIAEAGLSANGLRIPRSVTVRRGSQELDRDALERVIRPAVTTRLAPCAVESVRVPRTITLGEGEVRVQSEMRPPVRNRTSLSGMVTLSAGGVSRTVPVRVQLRCPPPVVQPGGRIRIVAQIGNVRATAPGEARQPGRIGDVIRVHNPATRRTLLARIVSESDAVVVR